MITFSSSGSFKNTDAFLGRMSKGDIFSQLDSAAKEGVNALSRATPRDSGETAAAWSYTVTKGGGSYKITWTNGHVVNGVPIAIILQYGHGTGTGGYVSGRDYINPAMRPIFDQIAEKAWKAVTSS